MREIIARTVCFALICALVALAWVFAWRHNPPVSSLPVATKTVPPPAASHRPEHADRGRAVFAEQNCFSCHAIAGEGNPRHPLEGVGKRRSPAELREWILGIGVAADELPASIVRRKKRYRTLTDDDLAALVVLLSRLDTDRSWSETQEAPP